MSRIPAIGEPFEHRGRWIKAVATPESNLTQCLKCALYAGDCRVKGHCLPCLERSRPDKTECYYVFTDPPRPKHVKPLDRNTQIGRLYLAMKQHAPVWFTTEDVAGACGGMDEHGRMRGRSCAPSTKISELRARLVALGGHERIESKPTKINGETVWIYQLQDAKGVHNG